MGETCIFLFQKGFEIMIRLKSVFLDAKCLVWHELKGKKITLRRFFFFKGKLWTALTFFIPEKVKYRNM